MRKKDPRYEITVDLKDLLVNAIMDFQLKSRSGKHTSGFLPLPDQKAEESAGKYIGGTQTGVIDELETPVLPKKRPDVLINEMMALIPDYFHAIDRGNARKLKEVLDKGFPVNYFSPVSGETALHSLAAGGARPAIRVLLTYENLDFLARDKMGRLSSELAYLYGNDPALARLLGNKERKQAKVQGIKLTRRPIPKPER